MDKNHVIRPDKGDVMAQDSMDIQTIMQNMFPMPFIRFNVMRTSMAFNGKNTFVEAEEHRFENGKLDSRYFEGILAGDMVKTMTHIMEQQMELFFNSLSLFTPFKYY